MPEPLKNLLHPALILSMAGHVAEHFSGFDRDRFVKLASNDLDQLELMQRALQIRDALGETLPDDFEQAAAILSASLPQDGRSGITGWAQVHGRDTIGWDERFRMDLWYIDNWSLWLDAKIVFKTFGELFRGEPEPVEDELNIERARAADE